MKIISGKIYALRIPFVEEFTHSTKNRKFSDSFVVRLQADDETIGYGEGAARPYVTGETVDSSIKFIKTRLFPAISETEYKSFQIGSDPIKAFAEISESICDQESESSFVPNAARAAVELALIDCLLKSQNLSLGKILLPKRDFVQYSGVITAGSVEKSVLHARRFKLLGIKYLKIKIGDDESVARVEAVRQTVGRDVSLRVDANGAYSAERSIEISRQLEPFGIDAFEQPIARGDVQDLAKVKQNSPVPIMVDESLVTSDDAKNLIDASACDFFNLRISKCGGILETLKIANMANAAGIRMQIGCQVGETAILSAAGRHLAAYLDDAEFIEGSYGNLLLTEDISRDRINFGFGGRAPILNGFGLGIEVRKNILEKYSHSIVNLKKECAKNA